MKSTLDVIIYFSTFLASFISLCVIFKKLIKKLFEPIEKRIIKMDVMWSKKFLVDFLNDVENGIEKDSVQYQFAHDTYDHYTNDLHKNSYIHDKWERVMQDENLR